MIFVAMACVAFFAAGALFTCVAIDWSYERTLNARCAFWCVANICVGVLAVCVA